MLLADGLDEAIIGVGSRCGHDDVAVYCIDTIIRILMRDDEMTEEDAWEHFDFNILGGWVGPLTPMFVRRMDAQQLREEADANPQIPLDLQVQ